MKVGQQAHHVKGGFAQRPQAFGLFVFLKQRLVGTQLGFDFIIGGQGLAISDPKRLGRLALGKAVIGDSILRHHSGSEAGDRPTHLVFAVDAGVAEMT